MKLHRLLQKCSFFLIKLAAFQASGDARVKLHLTNAEVGMWNAEGWSRFAKSFGNRQNTFIRRSMFISFFLD